jgi:hypothetical protein
MEKLNMSVFIQCPECKQDIENDSCYCDQCGEQILVCSLCGRPGKGKRCKFDGKELIPAGSGGTTAPSSATINIDQPPPVQPPPVQPPPPPSPPSPQAAGLTSGKITLSSPSQGITIEAANGDILGRSKGPHAASLNRFSVISGSHCKVIKTTAGWSIEDLGSTNGTFYNNNRLTPNVPVLVQGNTNVKLANVDFLVSFGEEDEGATVRV